MLVIESDDRRRSTGTDAVFDRAKEITHPRLDNNQCDNFSGRYNEKMSIVVGISWRKSISTVVLLLSLVTLIVVSDSSIKFANASTLHRPVKRNDEYAASSIDGSSLQVENTKFCHQNTPCGWAVYIPYTRRVDYFMKNTCSCSADKVCLKVDDDLSVSAYVYKCIERSSSTENDAAITYTPGS